MSEVLSKPPVSPWSTKPPEEVSATSWRQTKGMITAVADDAMRFVGIAFGGAAMRAETLSYRPAPDGCPPEHIAGTPIVVDHLLEAEAVVGVVEFGWVERGMLHVIGRLSATDRARRLWPAIADGALCGLSFTVSPHRVHREGDTVQVTQWSPVELSICAAGWDPDAKIIRAMSKEDILFRMIAAEEERRKKAEVEVNEAAQARVEARFEHAADLGAFIAAELGVDKEAAVAAAMRFVVAGEPHSASVLAAAP